MMWVKVTGLFELQLLRNEELDDEPEFEESSDADDPARCLIADSGHKNWSILLVSSVVVWKIEELIDGLTTISWGFVTKTVKFKYDHHINTENKDTAHSNRISKLKVGAYKRQALQQVYIPKCFAQNPIPHTNLIFRQATLLQPEKFLLQRRCGLTKNQICVEKLQSNGHSNTVMKDEKRDCKSYTNHLCV